MIQSIQIGAFRGIREGKLEELSPLTVLVGPNGSGKSTVLEAALVGAYPTTTQAIIHVLLRHDLLGGGARWLLWRGGEETDASIQVVTPDDTRTCYIKREQPDAANLTLLTVRWVSRYGGKLSGHVRTHGESIEAQMAGAPLQGVSEVRMVESYAPYHQRKQLIDAIPLPPHQLFSRMVERGRRRDAFEYIAEVLPSVNGLEILTEGDEPVLHLVYEDHSVPAALAGDGIVSLLELTLELAGMAKGTVLLEEPEVHQHPRAIRQSARAILTAVRRDTQVILTTHSLELLDAILAEATDVDLANFSLHRVNLKGGLLRAHRLPGPEVAFARGQIEDDLR